VFTRGEYSANAVPCRVMSCRAMLAQHTRGVKYDIIFLFACPPCFMFRVFPPGLPFRSPRRQLQSSVVLYRRQKIQLHLQEARGTITTTSSSTSTTTTSSTSTTTAFAR